MSSIASSSTSLRGCNVWNVWRERHRAPTPGARGRGERLDESALIPSPAPAASAASAALARSIDERLRQARPRLLRIAASFALPPDVAEDIAQEVALRAWRRLTDLRDTTQFDVWINTICRNQCRMRLRAQRRAPVMLSLAGASAADEPMRTGATGGEIADTSALDPFEMASADDAALLLERALAYLTPHERALLEMRYLHDLPSADVAGRLGIAPQTLEARLRRARDHLRATLVGPLRGDAIDFGLAAPPDDGWRATRITCYLCGRHKLLGHFETAVNGRLELRLRCPGCSAPDGGDIFRSKGIAPLDGLRAFRPALTRSWRALAERTRDTLATGADVCLHCGRVAPRRVATADEFPSALSQRDRRYWVVAPCSQPGCPGLGSWSALDAMLGANALAARFISEHPRWTAAPEDDLEWQGSAAIRFHLRDVTSAARLTIVADRASLLTLGAY